MKPNLMKYLIIAAVLILFGSGSAVAGGRNHYYRNPGASHYKGYHYKHHDYKHHGGGYRHHWPRYDYHHRYNDWPRYHHYYGPPRYHYYNHYYPGSWDRYDGAYYFSGGFSEPGVGFVFGTRGDW
jgi:hypothetical protein